MINPNCLIWACRRVADVYPAPVSFFDSCLERDVPYTTSGLIAVSSGRYCYLVHCHGQVIAIGYHWVPLGTIVACIGGGSSPCH